MPIFSDYRKISCQKLKQNKSRYIQELIKKYSSDSLDQKSNVSE